jgi:hypothetical protein
MNDHESAVDAPLANVDSAHHLSSTRDREAGPPWSRVFAAALFVIAVAAGFSYLMSEDSVERGETIVGAFTQEFADSFDRPAADSLGSGPGVTWDAERGTWAIQIGVVHLSKPDPFFNVVTSDAGSSDMSISANVGGNGLCGVTVRYRDPDNYLALLRANGFGVWNIIQVVNGKETSIGTVSDVAATNVDVRLEVGPDLVTASVGLFRTEVAVSAAAGGSKLGLIARGGAMETCTWDDAVGRQAA